MAFPAHPLRVGLTGGIGCGKSTVTSLFAALGAPIIDTDVIAHELTQAQGAAMPALVAAFGAEAGSFAGGLDRAGMRRLVFSDPAARARLEGILHPLILNECAARCRAETVAPYVLLVVPLLVELPAYRQSVARVLVVDCAPETQIARVMARSGLPADEVRAIMAAQAGREERLRAADEVLLNEGALGDLRVRVEALHRKYLMLGMRAKGEKVEIL